MSHGDVGEGEPYHDEYQDGREADALSKGTQDQRTGDRGEGTLEGHVDVLGDADALAEGRGDGVRRYAGQEGLVEAAEEGISLGEGQAA